MTSQFVFKIVIVGNSSVGKSSLIKRFVDDEFSESYLATIGVDFRFKTMIVDDASVKLQVWDTAGQQRFRTITSAYYKGAHGVFVVYDLTSSLSFRDVGNFWLGQIDKFSESNIKTIILGNKSDAQNKAVSKQEADSFARSKKIENFIVSAKSGQGLNEAFTAMVRELIKTYPKVEVEPKNKIVEEILKKKEEFKLKTGGMRVEKKKKMCCQSG